MAATIRSRWLGAELRKLRTGLGRTIPDVAREIEWTEAKISRIENGLVKAHFVDVGALLRLYGVAESDPLHPALIELARSAKRKGWWHGNGDTLAHPFADLISLEDGASKMATYEIHTIPGLLQTADYAHALVAGSNVWERSEDVRKFVEIRMARQAVLTRETEPLELWVILGEAALRQQVGAPSVMCGQLEHLLEVSSGLPNVTIQVMPYRAGAAGMFNPFVTLNYAAQQVVYVESLTGGLWLEDPEVVSRYARAYEHLRASALSAKESERLIRAVIEETKT